MRARDIMTSPVVIVAPDAHLKDVAATFVRRGINAAPVVDHGRLVGIVSEADIIPLEAEAAHRFAGRAAKRGPVPTTVREVMTRSVFTVAQDAEAAQAAQLMVRHNLKSVPVVVGDWVVGMVSRRDLLRLLARSDQGIQAEIGRRLEEETEALRRLAIDVHDGVVTFTGIGDKPARGFLEALARAVAGVVEVRWSAPDETT